MQSNAHADLLTAWQVSANHAITLRQPVVARHSANELNRQRIDIKLHLQHGRLPQSCLHPALNRDWLRTTLSDPIVGTQIYRRRRGNGSRNINGDSEHRAVDVFSELTARVAKAAGRQRA